MEIGSFLVRVRVHNEPFFIQIWNRVTSMNTKTPKDQNTKTHKSTEPSTITSLESLESLELTPKTEMANFLAAAHQNAQDIGALKSRIDDLERIITNSSLGKMSVPGKRSGKRSSTPEEKIRILSNRALEMEKDRRAIIAFNTINAARDPRDMIRWTERTVLKSGKERVMSFTQVDDNVSLKKLIQSEHRELLNNSLVGEDVNITTNIFKKYWVVVIDNKLVPLCRDFKGGLGREYLWTSDEDMVMHPPSTNWKNESKKKNDPRREMIDPQTMELWLPEDEMYPPITQEETRVSVEDGVYEDVDSIDNQSENQSDNDMKTHSDNQSFDNVKDDVDNGNIEQVEEVEDFEEVEGDGVEEEYPQKRARFD